MSSLEPASALAIRVVEDASNLDEATAIIEADRAAVRESALREVAEAVRSMRPDLSFARHESGEYKGGFREGHSSALAAIEKLLTEKRTP